MIAEYCADLAGRVLKAEEPDRQFYAASTMKVPVMVALFRRYDAGLLDLDAPVPITGTFTSVYDGSPFRIDAEDEDIDLVDGQERSVRELIERMITLSSNNATNLVLQLTTFDEVQKTVEDAGATRTVVARPIGDKTAARAGIQNLVTAGDLVRIMTAIATESAAKPINCRKMLDILARQQHRVGIASGLPSDVRTASKGGWVDGLRHDVAVIWPPHAQPYGHAICTEGLADDDAIAEIRHRTAAAYSTYGGSA